MKAGEYFRILAEELHTAVVATVDDEGLPVTAAIDMMDYDEDGVYFLTAKGKRFYERLTKRGYLALTAVKGADTMTSAALSLRGRVKEAGAALLPRLFRKNPYMAQIYPTEQSRAALTVFRLYEGTSAKGLALDSYSAAPLSSNSPETNSPRVRTPSGTAGQNPVRGRALRREGRNRRGQRQGQQK